MTASKKYTVCKFKILDENVPVALCCTVDILKTEGNDGPHMHYTDHFGKGDIAKFAASLSLDDRCIIGDSDVITTIGQPELDLTSGMSYPFTPKELLYFYRMMIQERDRKLIAFLGKDI